MISYRKEFSTDKYYFPETPFNELMTKRITEVLLVCSKYDKFTLEEDGRIDEQIFQEYVSLNLRYPPHFTNAGNGEEALLALKEHKFDLVIAMLNPGETDTFQLAKSVKALYPNLPIVVLTYFSREISLKLEHEDLSYVDLVFSWLGNSSLLLAIIKLLEDRMNVEHDVEKCGVQTIILVEDSIRYYSSYLPTIYKVLFQQARALMTEGLNEHQQNLRMRGRPKILLANDFEEAMLLYKKYKHNLLGVISDISYKREGVLDSEAGLKLCLNIRNENKELPILLQSSQNDHAPDAKFFNAGFIYKHSKTLLNELKEYIKDNFGFGDFVFRNPSTWEEVDRVENLRDLQYKILAIPDEVFDYHVSNNHFSKWLKARALYTLADLFKDKTRADFSSTSAVKQYMFDTIKNYRMYRGRGTIANFEKHIFDEFAVFTRIGDGQLGGKGRGLAFINHVLKTNRITYKFDNALVQIPKTIVLATDIFENFMEENNLYPVALSDICDEEILEHFLKAELPEILNDDLYALLSVLNTPLAVRSSSLLEDSHFQPFAGVYSTYMIPNNNSDIEIRFKELSWAIKAVYASTYYKNSKDYMQYTQNVIDEEKMAVVLQEVTGNLYSPEDNCGRFYPSISGVARSLNFYPVENEKTTDGIANIALGLGKTIVEGGASLRFSPAYTKKILQLSSVEMAMKNTQNHFYAIDMCINSFHPTTNEACNFLKLDLKDAEKDGSIKYLASTYDHQNDMLRDGIDSPGRKVLTFSGILKYNMFPLADILKTLLEVGSKEMGSPIEIEFAVNLDRPKSEPSMFKVLQIRPIVQGMESENIDIDQIEKSESIIYAKTALGNGTYNGIHDLIYIRPESFNPAETRIIADMLSDLNELMVKENKGYILAGPGRWGSSDPWLGIPVRWSQISNARAIVESSIKGFQIDPSQGSHFFQNVTSFRIAYLTINPHINDGYYDVDYLNSQPAVYENKYLRHLRFENQLTIKVNGKTSKAIILK